MKMTFLGATKTVTGSKYLLRVANKNILIDCGLYQGQKPLRRRNWDKLPIDPNKIDAVIITHAHIDHSGYLPVLVKNGFSGIIYCTRGTNDLCSILLPDSGRIHEYDAKRANKYGYTKHKPALPLYTEREAELALKQFVSINYNEPLTLFKTLSLTFLPAGHIIGSALVYLEHDNKSIVFTGDLGRPNHAIMRPPAIVDKADYLITESTYGDRLHDQSDALDEIEDIINTTASRGGSVIIPAFAVGRSQDILYYIYQLKTQNRIPHIPIFLDSPMAQDVSDLLAKYANEHRLTKDLAKSICKMAAYTRTADDSKKIDQYNGPMIIISASGMLEGGRILHHLKLFLPDSQNTIVLTGYQAPGTRGDRLQRSESAIKIHGAMIPIRAEIQSIDSLSAHADYQEIISWMGHFKIAPKKVFITHGDEDAAESLKSKIENELKWSCVIPDYLQAEELE